MTDLLGSLPEPELFRFPPTGHPAPIPPVHAPLSILHPFNIPEGAFVAALDARVPLIIGVLYAVTVKALTRYNLRRGKKPWAVSRTRIFNIFVILHNVFLAVYSAWTFWGMLGGMRRSIFNPLGPGGLAATADSFCRLHGDGGIGNSVYYSDASRRWVSSVADAAIVNGLPSGTATGRMWNEGLAYYGWIFYLSKFYEVLDTFIILAKGKPSSTLQTYHHTGAMLCMWAGMRYMGSPIWIFVVYNSFIHSLMYTYYTVTAFSIKVPVAIKRTLTTLQITQFVVGASYAAAHSFVSYVVPITVTSDLSAPAPSPAAIPTASGAIDSLKQLVLGHPGTAASPPAQAVAASAVRTTYVVEPCIVTSGETFAICLNVLYLAPLTYLFVSFFIASYVKRSNAAQKLMSGGKVSRRLSNVHVALAEKAGWDAAKGLEREVYGGEDTQETAVAEHDEVEAEPAKRASSRLRGQE